MNLNVYELQAEKVFRFYEWNVMIKQKNYGHTYSWQNSRAKIFLFQKVGVYLLLID